MTDDPKRYNGISKTAWGYFFIYFNLSMNSVSLLPSFIGYLLFLSAINDLKDEERELSLLYTMGVILTLWHGAEWIGSWVGADLDGAWQFVDIIISLVNLYFHFQLLTNLASIAAKNQPDGYEQDAKLLRYRTLQTVMLTAITIIINLYAWLSEMWAVISILLLIVYLIAGICLMKALFDLRKCLRTNEE
ncbi:MAG: hypothetical protein ACI4EG_14970 [Fusicatenibacter sp.]|nr:hypothetical protein [Fusicatenibacter sp.]